jgi:hypothetical protein
MLTTAARLAPRQRQRRQAAETEPDRGQAPVHLGTRAERGQPGSRAPGQPIGSIAKTHERGHDTLPIARNAASVHIAGQDDVPELGVPAGLASGMVVQSGATVDEEDAGALVTPPFIEHHDTVERRAVVRVLQVLRRQGHRHLQ